MADRGESYRYPATSRPWLLMPGIQQHGYRAYPLFDHIAVKLAAIFERHGTLRAPSTRKAPRIPKPGTRADRDVQQAHLKAFSILNFRRAGVGNGLPRAVEQELKPARAVSVADAVRAAREISLQQFPDELRHAFALAPRLLFRGVPELGGHAGRNLRGVPARPSQ